MKQIQFSLLKLKAELLYEVKATIKNKTQNEAATILAPQIECRIIIMKQKTNIKAQNIQ